MSREIIELFNYLKNEGYVDKYLEGKIEFIDFITLDECTEYLNDNKCELQKFMYYFEMLLFDEISDN